MPFLAPTGLQSFDRMGQFISIWVRAAMDQISVYHHAQLLTLDSAFINENETPVRLHECIAVNAG